MLNKLFVALQYILPQHLLTRMLGALAENTQPWIKNSFIRFFMHFYTINMIEAAEENPYAYPTFNDFFIRTLKPGCRPLAADNEVACPVDGAVAQIGYARYGQLIQAKGMNFDIQTLLGGDHHLAQSFYDGAYTTLYLAPYNYHRVHMPLAGTLLKTVFIPNKLFSVNKATTDNIPNLYCRNERLVSIFSTDMGMMAVVMVGAMVVGSIKTVWDEAPIRHNTILTNTFNQHAPKLAKGAEIGHFRLGSTVILIFAKNKVKWLPELQTNSKVIYGQSIGNIINL